MLKAGEGDKYERFDPRKVEPLHVLARKIARWTQDNFETLKNCDPVLPPEAFNRVGDNWRPLFAVAQVLGGDWPQRILDSFHSLKAGAEEMLVRYPDVRAVNGSSAGATAANTGLFQPLDLLADVRRVFEQAGVTRLFASTLVEALYAMPGRQYSELASASLRGRGVTDIWVGRQLSRLGIHSKAIRINGHRAKGYDLQDVLAAINRLQGTPPAPDFEI